MKEDRVNPLNVLEVRRVDYCPSYFEKTVITPRYNLHIVINEWIYSNLSGRYYIGNALAPTDEHGIKQTLKIGFENPKELSYFMLACPHLKYNT